MAAKATRKQSAKKTVSKKAPAKAAVKKTAPKKTVAKKAPAKAAVKKAPAAPKPLPTRAVNTNKTGPGRPPKIPNVPVSRIKLELDAAVKAAERSVAKLKRLRDSI